jgi:prevent-host-death family protein
MSVPADRVRVKKVLGEGVRCHDRAEMSSSPEAPKETLGVAEAKRRFAELIERVGRGEQILISKRGKPAVALVRPDHARQMMPNAERIGLAAVAGALADWDDFEEVVAEIMDSRRRARDRPAPDLG